MDAATPGPRLEGNAKSTVDSLRMPLFLNFQVPLPPLQEQQLITSWLDSQAKRIDKMIDKIGTAVERLQEYRTVLITAAVTGKIDVRRQTADNALEPVTAS